MKQTLFSLISLLAAVAPLAAVESPAASQPAQVSEAQNDQAKPLELTPNQKAFLNLAEERRKDFIKFISEANRLFQQKRIF